MGGYSTRDTAVLKTDTRESKRLRVPKRKTGAKPLQLGNDMHKPREDISPEKV